MARLITLIVLISLFLLPSVANASIDKDTKVEASDELGEVVDSETSTEEKNNEQGITPDEDKEGLQESNQVKSDTNREKKNGEKEITLDDDKESVQESDQLNKKETESTKRKAVTQDNNSDKIEGLHNSISNKDSNPKSADEWYEVAMSEPTASGRVQIFVEAYTYYPDTEKISNGLNASVKKLLDWASEQHDKGNYETAVDRYDTIISISGISKNTIDEAMWKKTYADNNTRFPTPNELYKQAISERTASGRLNAFIKAYELFPADNRIKEGVHTSAELLLEWAINQHNSGKFVTAIDRYQRILTAPTLTNSIRIETESLLENAQSEKRPADAIYEDAVKELSASRKLGLYIKGYESYPDDNRFFKGIDTSGRALLKWARGKHQTGDFATAVNRYNRILQAPAISKALEESTNKHMTYAREQRKVPSANTLLKDIKKQSKVSDIFNKSTEGFLWYPEKSQFKNELNKASRLLLSWAKGRHKRGEFETAKNRYDMLLGTSYVDEKIKQEAAALREDAEIKKRSAGTIYQEAREEKRASYKLELFMEGYEFYPEDKRFAKGVRDSASALLNWAIKQHHDGAFKTAIDRYEYILSVPKLQSSVRKKAEAKLKDARIGKRPADVIFNLVQEYTTATGLFDLNSEGHRFYPDDERFQDGLALSAKALVDLATRYHQRGDFSRATSRYEKLIKTDGVPNSIDKKAQLQMNYSASEEYIPTIDNYIDYADDQKTVSSILNAYVEGYWIYDKEPRMIDGVLDSAHGLLRWATKQHQKGEFQTAKDRYSTILGLPVINDKLERETELKSDYAKNKQTLPTADHLYEEARDNSKASYQLKTYVKGYILYPEDSRFIDGIAESSESLQKYAYRQQEKGHFETAIDRYERILSSPGVPDYIRLEVELRKKYAQTEDLIPSADNLYHSARNDSTVSGKFNKYVEGYVFYPEDDRFRNGISTSAYALYRYATKLHQNKDFTGAISRYENLISSPGVPEYIVESAIRNLEYANQKSVPENEVIKHSEYDLTLEEVLEKQMKVSPQTDKYRNKQAYINSNYVDIIKSAIITGDGVNLRTAPNLAGKYVTTSVNSGTKITILDEVKGDSHAGSTKWYKIKYNDDTLYVHSSLANPNGMIARTTASVNIRAEANSTSHIYDTVPKGTTVNIIKKGGTWHKISYDTWRNATRNDTKEYLDPAKFINDETQKYQFLDLRYFTGISSAELNSLLIDKYKLEGMGEIFREAARKVGINELYLISHALLETGHGKSDLAKGVKYKGKTVYNFFGIGAYDNCAKDCGAKKAYEEGWYTVEKAIIGGAQFAGDKYINAGQNTLYTMRWNPQAIEKLGYADHQYATDIGWASKQVYYYTQFYSKGDYDLRFNIPVYK